jgi:hypothetical protein
MFIVIVTCDQGWLSDHAGIRSRGRIRRIDVATAHSIKILKDTVFVPTPTRRYSAFEKNQELEHHKIKVGKQEIHEGTDL